MATINRRRRTHDQNEKLARREAYLLACEAGIEPTYRAVPGVRTTGQRLDAPLPVRDNRPISIFK